MASNGDVVEAVRGGNLDRLQSLLREDPSLAAARDEAGVSAVLLAHYRSRTDLVDALLARRPRLDVFDAAALGRTQVVAARIDEDPGSVSAWSGDGFTALHLAAFFARPDAAALLLERGADPAIPARNASLVTPLHSAAAGRSIEIVRMLLMRGVDANARQLGGWTALHAAAAQADEAMIRLLLGHGAFPQVAADDGTTASALASGKGHTAVVELLL